MMSTLFFSFEGRGICEASVSGPRLNAEVGMCRMSCPQLTNHIVYPKDHPHHLSRQKELLSLRDERIIHMLRPHICRAQISRDNASMRCTDHFLPVPYNQCLSADCSP